MKLLKDIAVIQTGVFAKTVTAGDVVYIQAKHFDDAGNLKKVLHADVDMAEVSPKHLLQPSDVLFSAKGTKNFAAVYEEHNPPCVASTSFFVIRVYDSAVLPHYLVWFLNSPATQRKLKGQAKGSSIASISKSVLEDLEISIPVLQKQQAVLQISNLRNTEKKLHQQIQSLREKLIQQQIINAIK